MAERQLSKRSQRRLRQQVAQRLALSQLPKKSCVEECVEPSSDGEESERPGPSSLPICHGPSSPPHDPLPGLTLTRSLPPEPLPSLNDKGYLGCEEGAQDWIVDDLDLREGNGEDSDGVGSMEGEAEKTDEELESDNEDSDGLGSLEGEEEDELLSESDNDVSADECSSEHDFIGLDHERDDDGVPLFPNSGITYDDFNSVFVSCSET